MASPLSGLPRTESERKDTVGDLLQPPVLSHYNPYNYLTNVTDLTLGASGLWLGTRTGGSGTATLA